MRCVILGTMESSKKIARAVMDCGATLVAMISLKKELLPNNSVDIKSFAESINVAYYETEDINKEEDLMRTFAMDMLIFVWPRIIKPHIFNLAKVVTFGIHSTKLPHNRGRHALHWSKVLGLRESAISFFEIDCGLDTGKIILQIPFKIEDLDTINTLNAKVDSAMYEGVVEILKNPRLLRDKKPQEGEGNYWRKRNMHDVLLDMRMSCGMIIRTVQSFTFPYPCAQLVIENQIIPIVEAQRLVVSEDITNMEHGKIYKIEDNAIALKCEDGIVQLKSKEDNGFAWFKDNILCGGGGIFTLQATIFKNIA